MPKPEDPLDNLRFHVKEIAKYVGASDAHDILSNEFGCDTIAGLFGADLLNALAVLHAAAARIDAAAAVDTGDNPPLPFVVPLTLIYEDPVFGSVASRLVNDDVPKTEKPA